MRGKSVNVHAPHFDGALTIRSLTMADKAYQKELEFIHLWITAICSISCKGYRCRPERRADRDDMEQLKADHFKSQTRQDFGIAGKLRGQMPKATQKALEERQAWF